MKPLVSILIPAYNAGQWIASSLRSAIAQTWDRKEIVVVDDGSTDDTLATARTFESETVRILTQDNRGAATTRNRAFALAQGDYVQWLDADDLLAPDKIAQQMEAAQHFGPRKLLSCGFGKFLYRASRARFRATPLWENLSPAEWLVRKMGLDLHMQTATWLTSRELTEAAGPWNTELLGDDDGEYFCRVLLQSDGVEFVPDAKVYYRAAGAASLSYIGVSNRKRDAQWRSMLLHIKYLRSLEDSPRSRAACVSYLQNWSVFFYPDRTDLIGQVSELAASLGGEIHPPRFSWKYAWIESAMGPEVANRFQIFARSLRWRCASAWDRAAWRVEQWATERSAAVRG